MKILTWNILHGGGRRVAQIAVELVERAPDLIVLSEFRGKMAGQLRGILAEHGWQHQALAGDDLPGEANAVLIASRWKVEARPLEGNPVPRRALEVRLPERDLTVIGCHIPDQPGATDRVGCWRAITNRAKNLSDAQVVVIGDFNTGRHLEDEVGRGFSNVEALGALWTCGYRDAFRLKYPDAREASWADRSLDPGTADVRQTGFKSLQNRELQQSVPLRGVVLGAVRIDGAWVSQRLANSVSQAKYDHAVRQSGVSDHSIFTLELNDAKER
jgi:exonuclease III